MAASASLLANRNLGESDNGRLVANLLAWHLGEDGFCSFIQFNAKPTRLLANETPNQRRVLADARCEHQNIKTTDCCCERTDFSSRPVTIEFYRLARIRMIRLFQYVHVIADT